MTDGTGNDLPADPASTEETGRAALIATFYGRRRDGPLIQGLQERLYRGFLPESREPSTPAWWENRADQVFGHCFRPSGRAALDTVAVQVALNADGSAAKAWPFMRDTLETKLEINKGLEDLWGYTLVYQAVLKAGVDPDKALRGSVASIGRLVSNESIQPLAAAEALGGRLWLLGIPDLGDGWAAGTVYCALGPPEGEEALLDLFYGPAAKLLTPDLIAHKGYYQMRQYRGEDLERKYEERLKELRQTTAELLHILKEDKEDPPFNKLSQKYYQLGPVDSKFKELHVGMLRQLKNYDRWREGVMDNDVVDFHGGQLEAAADELELIVQPLEDSLNKADKAVSLAQAQETKNLERILVAVTAVLATVTGVLATVEIITWHIPHDWGLSYLVWDNPQEGVWPFHWSTDKEDESWLAALRLGVLCLIFVIYISLWLVFRWYRRR